jgi:hypothetical protein
MLKNYIFQPILKNCTAERVWMGQARPEKIDPRWICDFDGHTGSRDWRFTRLPDPLPSLIIMIFFYNPIKMYETVM